MSTYAMDNWKYVGFSIQLVRGYASELEGKPQKEGGKSDNIQMWEKTEET